MLLFIELIGAYILKIIWIAKETNIKIRINVSLILFELIVVLKFWTSIDLSFQSILFYIEMTKSKLP